MCVSPVAISTVPLLDLDRVKWDARAFSSLLDEDVLLHRRYLRFSHLALPRPLGPAYCLYWRVTLMVPRPVFFYEGLRGATVPCGLPVTCHGWMPLRVRRASPSLLVIAWLLWTTSRGD